MRNRYRMLSFGIPVLLILSILSSALVIGREKPAELVFWTAPNKFQNRYNKEIVDTWNRENPDIKIKWTPIPQGESSEEVIFAAIASGTAPNLLTNVFSGFAETLAKDKVLIPLDTLPGFEELIKERDMVDIIEYYRSPDGHIYVIPIYTNAMLWRYNKELLDELGLDKPPRTYDELLSLADKVVVPHKRWLVLRPYASGWWERWFDFMTIYYAAGGKHFLKDGKAAFNNDAGITAAKFWQTLYKNGYAPPGIVKARFETGNALCHEMGPWLIPDTAKYFPGFEYVLSPPPVPDGYPENSPIYTFSDSKGIVLLANTPEEMIPKAWKFVKERFSLANDVKWFEITGMPPSRGDLLANPAFANALSKQPEIREFARGVPYALPPPMNPYVIETQKIFTDVCWEPLVYGRKTVEQAIKDAEIAINEFLASQG